MTNQTPRTPSTSGSTATILLVDDNPTNLAALTRSLTQHGFRVLVAQHGESGIQIAQRVNPDLIMLDVQLPGSDGFEICRRLKSDLKTSDIPVLFMTVRSNTTDRLTGFEAGAVDYITKPFQEAEVLARINTHIHLRQLTSSLQHQNERLVSLEASLRLANEALEHRVQERTADLIQVNHELSQQIQERLVMEEQLRAATQHLQTLHAAERHARQVADLLRTTNLALSQSLDRSMICQIVQACIQHLLPGTQPTILLWEPHARFRVYQSACALAIGPTRLMIGTIYERADFPLLEQISTTPPQLNTITSQDGIHPADVDASITQSWLGMPLTTRGETLGLLLLIHPQPHFFTNEQRLIVEAIAAQTAISLQNAYLFSELQTAQHNLQAVSRQLVQVQEAERAQIARDLHDEIGQMLTGLKLMIAIGKLNDADEVARRLRSAQDLVNDLTTRVREISLDLHPAMLDDLGLLPTLLWYSKRYTAQTNISVTIKHTGFEQRVTPDIEIAIYRIVQEALTNIARYAHVNQAAILLWRNDSGIGVRIEDKGQGFNPQTILSHYSSSGLVGMTERARLLGGQLTIESAPGAGTRITFDMPWPSSH
ncbi:MAG: hypothetical protein Fur005_45450 [Roseiflexaceae bacterium]